MAFGDYEWILDWTDTNNLFFTLILLVGYFDL